MTGSQPVQLIRANIGQPPRTKCKFNFLTIASFKLILCWWFYDDCSFSSPIEFPVTTVSSANTGITTISANIVSSQSGSSTNTIQNVSQQQTNQNVSSGSASGEYTLCYCALEFSAAVVNVGSSNILTIIQWMTINIEQSFAPIVAIHSFAATPSDRYPCLQQSTAIGYKCYGATFGRRQSNRNAATGSPNSNKQRKITGIRPKPGLNCNRM